MAGLPSTGGRPLGPFGLFLVGVGGIIGSGWLFAAARAAGIAGPASILAWIIGFFIILVIALVMVELGPMFVKMGGVGRYAVYTHGGFVAFVADWATFVAFVSSIPSEASATIQFAAGLDIPWLSGLFDPETRQLSTFGLVATSFLCVVYFMLNYLSMQLLVRSIKAMTAFKIVVPLITAGALIATGFQPENLGHGAHGLEPFGFNAVLTAITLGGVVYTFNGFQTPLNFAREVERPAFSLPFAVVGSLTFSLIVFLALQVAFIGAVPHQLVQAEGWHGIHFTSPLAELALSWHLAFIAQLLAIDAMVSPSGSGIIFFAVSGRALFGIERDGHAPKMFGRLEPESGLPRTAMFGVLVLAIASLWLFPSWSELAAVISVCYVIAYAVPVVVLGALNRVAPDLPRPVRIPGSRWLAPIGFVLVSWLFFWSRWPLTIQVMLVIAVGLLMYLAFELPRGWPGIRADLKRGGWMISHFAVLVLVSAAGSADFGGYGWLPPNGGLVLTALSAIVHYRWAVHAAEETAALVRYRQGNETAED